MASKMIAKDAKASLFFLRGLNLAGAAKTVTSHGGELGQVLRISTQKPLAESAILLRRQHAYEEGHPSKVDLGVGRLVPGGGGGGGFGVSDARIWGMSYHLGLEAKAGRGSRRVVDDDDKDDDDDDDGGGGVDDVYDSEDDLDSDSDDIYDDTLPHRHIDDDDD